MFEVATLPDGGSVEVCLGSWQFGPKQPERAQVERLQDYLATLPQIPNEPRHWFAEGMYGRELPIQADAFVVGKIHRHEHITILLCGSATINTDRGMERITGPHVWISPPGAKRALYTHTDCVFFTCHLNPGNARDLDLIEADVIVPEPRLAQDAPQLAEFAAELQGIYE
jgi:hypothetical protein